jgi:GntR family transcriptional regulator
MENKKPYVILYWDILSKLDNPYELSVYVYLRKHADHTTGTCFPSIATLEKETKISEKKIRLILKDLKEKKLITIQNRTLGNGGKTSNIYRLLEFENEEVQASLQESQDEEAPKQLSVGRKRVSGMDQADQSESKQDTQLKSNITNLRLHDNTKNEASQAENRREKVAVQTKYSTEEIKKKYNYTDMISENPSKQENIDICIDIIATTINNKKDTIRIQKEEIQREKVAEQLLKLTKEDILWAIKRFEQQPNQIHSPKAYLLTLLYDAKSQRALDLQNQKSVAAAAAAPPKAQQKAVARGTQAFQNFTERKNNNYTSKIMDKLKSDLKEFQEAVEKK